MTFQVGDRVRCIHTHMWGAEGDIGTITHELDGLGRVRLQWDDSSLDLDPFHSWFIDVGDIEHLEPATPPDTQEVIRYALVYEYPDSVRPHTMFFSIEGEVPRAVRNIEVDNGVILAKKKLKFVVPVVTFPELNLDENDNIIDEEDDGNAF